MGNHCIFCQRYHNLLVAPGRELSGRVYLDTYLGRHVRLPPAGTLSRHSGLLFSKLDRPAHRCPYLRFDGRLTTTFARLSAKGLSICKPGI
jgi:hypothetical protein